MNEFNYEELLNYVKSIPKFRMMVSSESRRGTAIKLVMYLAGIDKHTAIEFINEYYSRMDVRFSSSVIGNEMSIRSDNAFKTQTGRHSGNN